MSSCDYCDRCFFFNEPLFDNLENAEFLRTKFCVGEFTECSIYKLARAYGIGRIRASVYPDEVLENVTTAPYKECRREGGNDMFLRVVYPDGKLGMVRSKAIDGLIKACKIVAFNCSDGWIETRRRQNIAYKGPERRVINAF